MKEDLKSKQPVNCGTLNYGAICAQTHGDFLDKHFYFGGLAAWGGRPWDASDWYARNLSFVRNLDNGQAQNNLGLRVLGFPYTISEASQMHQASTAADFFPILFSLAAFQNHVAIHTYTWTHAPDHSYGSTKYLDMHGNAKYLAHLPAAHNMFVRGDVKSGFTGPARILYGLDPAAEREEIHSTGYAHESNSRPMDPLACVKAVTGLRLGDQSSTAIPTNAVRRAVSSTGEITWDATVKGREFYAVDTPRTKFLSQFGPAGTVHRFVDGTTFTLGETLMGWAALSLTETASNTWFLAATGWQQPTGAVARVYGEKEPLTPSTELAHEGKTITTMGAMGTTPFMCEGVRASLRLPAPTNRLVRITPLNGNGLPQAEPFELLPQDGFVTFEISEQYQTVWYGIEFRAYDLPAFGDPIPGSGYDPTKPDCGLSAARVFDAQIAGLTKIGELQVPHAKDLPETSAASIGFEGLDRKLFEPDPIVYERLGACGVKRARVQTMWSRCETVMGSFDFSELDGVVDSLLAQGVRPWFSVSFGNTLYMKGCYTKAAVGCVPLYHGEECRQAWLRYVRELARRYRGKVREWEIWNECNLPQFWQPRRPNAKDYLELVKITGGVIREEIPDAKIGGCSAGMGIRDWEKEFFEAGGAKLVDFWCGHAYGPVPERYRGVQRVTTKGEEPDFAQEMTWVRKFLDDHEGRHVAIWQGESGFPSWFPTNHWLFPRGVCPGNWQSQANQAKWLLRRWLTDRRAGLAVGSFYQCCDITRHYSMATSTQTHPAEHGILNGWTYEPKMSYFALGHYNALFATARFDPTLVPTLTPDVAAGTKTRAFAFRNPEGVPLFVYYTPFDFSRTYTGKVYSPRTDATLRVPKVLAPADPVLVDLLRGGVFAVSKVTVEGDTVAYTGLPLTDYPLVLASTASLRKIVKKFLRNP